MVAVLTGGWRLRASTPVLPFADERLPMREVYLLIGGIIVGLMIAMPVGPVNVLCIHRTLEAGWKSGVISGLGAAAADMLYGGIAGFSITLVIQFVLREQFWIRFFGGILLVVIGIFYFFKRPAPLNAQTEGRGSAYSDMRSRSEERRVGKECRSRWSPYH